MNNLVILATHNKCKIEEFRPLFEMRGFDLEGLDKFNITEDCDEPHDTLQFNAIDKVNFYHKLLLKNEGAKKQLHMYNKVYIASEDSGLYVKALPNELGVKSKRFAESGNDDDNNVLLLSKMFGVANRDAHYDTSLVISPFGNPEFIINTTGSLSGLIATSHSPHGFAYDKVLIVAYKDEIKYLGELILDQKNEISSRRKAIDSLFTDYLDTKGMVKPASNILLKEFLDNNLILSGNAIKDNISLFSKELGKTFQFDKTNYRRCEILEAKVGTRTYRLDITFLNSLDLIGRVFKDCNKNNMYTRLYEMLTCLNNRGLGLLLLTMVYSRHSNYFTKDNLDAVKREILDRINEDDYETTLHESDGTTTNDFFHSEDYAIINNCTAAMGDTSLHEELVQALKKSIE